MAEENALSTAITQRSEGAANLRSMLVRTNDAGHRELVVPAELGDRFNVLAPTAVLAQQVDNFSPGFTVVTLNPGQIGKDGKITGGDFYSVDKNALKKGQAGAAIDKVGLRKLSEAGAIRFGGPEERSVEGDAADVTFEFGDLTKTIRGLRSYKYIAQGFARRADGTLVSYRAENEWNPIVAALEIEEQVLKNQYLKSNKERLDKAVSEFLRSFKFRGPMAKSKAQNAIVRDALKIKAKYTWAECQRPFFIVSFDFTPADTASGRALMAAMYGAEVAVDALYGEAPVAESITALPESASLDTEVPADVMGYGDDEVLDAEFEVVEDEPAFEMTVEEMPPASNTGLSDDEIATLDELGRKVLIASTARGNTLSAMWEGSGVKWFDSAIAHNKANPTTDGAIVDMFAAIEQYRSLRLRAEGGGE